MTNTCKSCGEIVTPGPDGSPCPNCGSMAGYTVSNTFTFRHKIEDGISKYDKQIERLKKFQEIYKGTKVEENLEVKIKNLKKIIKDLENLSLKKPDEEIILADEFKGSDKVIVEKFIEKEPETKTKTFTIDTVLVKDKADSKIKEGDKIVAATDRELLEDVLKNQNITTGKIQNIEDRLSHKETILLGLGIGIIGSIIGGFIVFFMTGLNAVPVEPIDFISATVNGSSVIHP